MKASTTSTELLEERKNFLELAISDEEAESLSSPRELVDVLERKLSGIRPNHAARLFLTGLASEQQRPEFAAGLDGPWRREQIAALVRELVREEND
jgi:hypothetical protein